MMDKEGFLLSHPDRAYAMKQYASAYAETLHSPTMKEALKQILAGKYGQYRVTTASESYTLYGMAIPDSEWKIALFLNNAILYEPLHQLKRKLLFIVLAGLGLLSVMLMLILREFKKDIVKRTVLQHELTLAREIQMNFLPKERVLLKEPFELHSYLKAAKEIGGDLYGYQTYREGILFYVGDVSGKGIPAALFMMATQIVLKNAMETTTDPAEILRITNHKLLEIGQSRMFVTLLLIRYDFKHQKLTFCNAGHPAFMVKTERLFSPLSTFYPPVNTFEGIAYTNSELTLERPFRLICFSDGVTEAENRDKALFGIERVAESVASTCTIETLKEALGAFVRTHPQNDDITILVFYGHI
jgi:sigma-B regulation protein RsbU (phosphoserine phosphatase)